MADPLIWYVSYGSNMHADRLAAYLSGGVPPGASRTYPGARDPRPPRRSAALWLPGGVYFATHSPVWNGGRAFYDPALPGEAAARGWLMSTAQFSDITAQEMYRTPGTDLDLTELPAAGRVRLGDGRYETLLHLGELDGAPLVTLTAPWSAADVLPVTPSLAYLRMLAAGLMAAHSWDVHQSALYLTSLPGAETWDRDDLARQLAE